MVRLGAVRGCGNGKGWRGESESSREVRNGVKTDPKPEKAKEEKENGELKRKNNRWKNNKSRGEQWPWIGNDKIVRSRCVGRFGR